MTTKYDLVPLTDGKNLKVTKAVDEIVRRLTSLTRDDLAKLQDEVEGVLDLVRNLDSFICNEVTKQKKAHAKKAIKILIDEGFPFENIGIDYMYFEIDENKKIKFTNPDDDIPF